jgi:hypothetical protein
MFSAYRAQSAGRVAIGDQALLFLGFDVFAFTLGQADRLYPSLLMRDLRERG